MVRFGKSSLAAVCAMVALSDPCWAQLQRDDGGSVKGASGPHARTRNLKSKNKSTIKSTSKSKGKSKSKSKGKGEDSCGSPDCKNTIPDFVKNILNLGFDEDTELFSGFGYCEGDFDENFDKLCCSASALRATIGATWLDFIISDGPTPFIPSTQTKPNFLGPLFDGHDGGIIIIPPRKIPPRKLSPGTSKKPKVNVGETEAILDGLFKTDGLAAAMETALGEPETRRRLGISDIDLNNASRKLKQTGDGTTRHLQEFENDDGVVCILAVVIAWFVEFYIGEEMGMGGGPIASGVGDAIRKIGCDISGLLTSTCEDFSPVINLEDFEGFEGVVGGYIASELPFLVCKLVKEAIAALALFIFSPWILPACHCDYRTEKQCTVSSCYDEKLGENGRHSFVPKQDLIDDISVAATQYFPFQGIGFTELLRSCNAIPGDRSYFIGRLPEGAIGSVLGDLPFLSDDNPIAALITEEIADALAVIGNCFDQTSPETLAFEDAEIMYDAIEAGVDAADFVGAFVEALDRDMLDCLDGFTDAVTLLTGPNAAGASLLRLAFALAGILQSTGSGGISDFTIAATVAVTFFFAGGGDPENLDISLPGLLNEILGDDLIDAIFNLELGGGLFPVRRGGKPFDDCLGYCFMHGDGSDLTFLNEINA